MRGLVEMIQSGRSCEDVALQMSAARKAMDKAFYRMMACTVMEAVYDSETEEARHAGSREVGPPAGKIRLISCENTTAPVRRTAPDRLLRSLTWRQPAPRLPGSWHRHSLSAACAGMGTGPHLPEPPFLMLLDQRGFCILLPRVFLGHVLEGRADQLAGRPRGRPCTRSSGPAPCWQRRGPTPVAVAASVICISFMMSPRRAMGSKYVVRRSARPWPPARSA